VGKSIGTRTTEISLFYVADDLHVSPAQLNLSVDDKAISVPIVSNIQLATAETSPITWTTVISPPVAWLQNLSPANGSVSNTTSPLAVTLTATRPVTYGLFTTTVLIQGTHALGVQFSPQPVQITITYSDTIPLDKKVYLPLIFPGPLPDWWPLPPNTP
jgi:hypothetical protein